MKKMKGKENPKAVERKENAKASSNAVAMKKHSMMKKSKGKK